MSTRAHFRPIQTLVLLQHELVALVRQLRHRRPKGGQRSLREIAAPLAQRGLMNERGKPFSAASINSMLP